MSTTPVETPDVKVPVMTHTYFKAVRENGTDFHSGTVRWLPADGAPIPEGGWLVEHHHPGQVGSWDAIGYLSAASVETDCTSFLWPARLLSVEPVGDVWTPRPDSSPRKRAAHAWRVTEELPAWQLFGPQGRQVAALIEQASHLTSAQMDGLTAALNAAQDADQLAAWNAALNAALNAARGAALNAARGAALASTWFVAWFADQLAAWYAAQNAIMGALVADVLNPDTLRLLVDPWEQVVGRVIA
ncbi:hypothetical protein BI041_gp36 [Propionibacterium phage PFR2]|uniref:Uncharacterized protein n=2 Tax=Pulverervirus PFR1 TaxID=2170091 RepID=A0A173G9Z6_9CAUD|nr:hypothetical protein [Propionibacterium freudenreichii]YP_009287710.1 hypothetical protein BI042_gp34 [Propionibacterium phage PFR1]YP_009290943.1 hypothetical protein BI041_gp36 [Propionibacterium phage PFR2]ANH49900.1 hypothetical protein PFR_34 [Propionibacterium phage PFR1]ANH49959.1 hypothetical protein PFR2_34 [Propionibacterium phage PFR2]MDK9674409.1 hypothetical protein [Propionibacterium freudenreichii]CEI46717.1 Protein of unknown function [Propionibacterium freudenreichii]SCQ4